MCMGVLVVVVVALVVEVRLLHNLSAVMDNGGAVIKVEEVCSRMMRIQ